LHRALDAGSDRPWRVLTLSRSGARAADVLGRQLPSLEAVSPPPDLVTCAIGANDVVRLPQGLNRARTEVANRVIRESAPAAGLLVADVWARTGPPWRGKLAADGFHPGALGYADWAAAFAEVVGEALSPRPPEPGQPPHRLGSVGP
ncbi:MAG: hypothetical protein M3203_05725, partial [Actinomycetota bacterium]|nr:hypothetical protein [Actinomycetota bacterium]